MLSLITDPNGVSFENLYIYSKTLDQEKYRYLREVLQPIKGIGFYTFDSSENVMSVKDMKPNSFVVFDDVINDHGINRDICRDIFTLGRHRMIDCAYLIQSYAKLSKHLIKDNTNFIIIFRTDDTNLKHIYTDFGCNSDMTFDEFRKFCQNCWKEKYGFATVSLEHNLDSGRYRKNLDEYLKL